MLLLLDEFIHHVAIHTYETYLLVLRLEVVDVVAVELTVHLQHIVTLMLRSLHKWVLINWIIHIEQNYVVVLVGLILLYKVNILLGCEILTLG